MRVLPTLLGALVLLGGFIAFIRAAPPPLPPPERVVLEPSPTEAFGAVLVQQTEGELRTRNVQLQAAADPGTRLGATFRALRTWLVEEGAWPRELGTPRVFWLGPGRAALDFPLQGRPVVTVTTELWLLGSVRETAARGGVEDPFILVNGRVPPTFLGAVALPETLELVSNEQ